MSFALQLSQASLRKVSHLKFSANIHIRNGCSDEQCGPDASCTSFQNKY